MKQQGLREHLLARSAANSKKKRATDEHGSTQIVLDFYL
jgi:hypothetical protein